MTITERLNEIPDFASEAEEHAFWATHEFSGALLDQADPLEADELPPPQVRAAQSPKPAARERRQR